MSEKVFNSEEVERIIKRAINRGADYSNGITESDLFRIASELNISREQILRSMQEDKELHLFEQAKKVWLDKKRSSFKEHLTAFLIINLFLFGINYFTLGTVGWALFPFFGWGIGLAFDFMESFYPSQIKIEEGAKKMMKSNKWKKLFENFEGKIIDEVIKKIKI